MAKLTTVRQPLRFLATAGEGIFYLLCMLFGYQEWGERGSPLPVSVVGVLPPCQQQAVAEGGTVSLPAAAQLGDESVGGAQPPPGGLRGEERCPLATGSRCLGR